MKEVSPAEKARHTDTDTEKKITLGDFYSPRAFFFLVMLRSNAIERTQRFFNFFGGALRELYPIHDGR